MSTIPIISASEELEWIEACNENESCEIESINGTIAFIENSIKPTTLNSNNKMEFLKNIPRSFEGSGVNKLWVLINNKSLVVRRPIFNPPINVSSTDFAGNTGLNTVIGESIVGEITDDFNVMFEYNVGTYDTDRIVTGTGSITHADAKAQMRTGAGIGSTTLSSKDPLNYRTGHQVNAEGTGVFAIPQVGVTQKIGLGNDVETLAAFGYDGLVWGIWLQTIEDGKIHIPRSQFNGDKVDGSGESGFTLNPQAENLYKIFYGWYGVLPIVWAVHVKGTGYVMLNTYDMSNEDNTPHLSNPSIPFITKIERLSGSGGDMALETSSWRGGIIGKRAESSLSNRKFLIKTVKTISGVNVPIYSIKNNATFQGKVNHVVVSLATFTASSEGTKQVEVDLYIGGVLTGGIWNAIDVENSVVDYNNTATSYTPPTMLIGGTVLGKVDRARINLNQGDVRIPVYPGQELHIVGVTANASDFILYGRHSEGF